MNEHTLEGTWWVAGIKPPLDPVWACACVKSGPILTVAVLFLLRCLFNCYSIWYWSLVVLLCLARFLSSSSSTWSVDIWLDQGPVLTAAVLCLLRCLTMTLGFRMTSWAQPTSTWNHWNIRGLSFIHLLPLLVLYLSVSVRDLGNALLQRKVQEF